MNHLEIEYKTLLDKEEYQSLLPLFADTELVGDGVCCFHIAVAMIYSNDFCVSEFSHKKYLRFRID